MLHQSTGRTYIDALSALDTRRIREAAVLRRGNDGAETTVLKAKDSKAMRILAARHAASAQDTLAGVTDKRRSDPVNEDFGVCSGKCVIPGTDQLCYMKQFAMTVLVTLLAVLVVVGEQQLYRAAACLDSLRRRDPDLHAIADRIDTARDQSARAGRLDQTGTAGTLVALTMIEGTQRRNLIATGLGSFQNRQAFLNLIFNSFNFNLNHSHAPPLIASRWL